MNDILKIGSRDSRLAVIQSEIVIKKIKESVHGIDTELVTMKTTGDKVLDKTLDLIGGKGLFLKELDIALAEKRVDICVHSLKDVPVAEDHDHPICAYTERESPYDVLVLPAGVKSIDDIDRTKPVGSSSLRRTIQFKKIFKDMEISSVRGNLQTRLRKLDNGEYSALILAEAGLARLGLKDRISYRFSPDEMIPAAGQGVIAVQGRKGEYEDIFEKINDKDAELCAKTERMVSRLLGGDCSSPIGVFCSINEDEVVIRCFYADGEHDASVVMRCSKSDIDITAHKTAEEVIRIINEKKRAAL